MKNNTREKKPHIRIQENNTNIHIKRMSRNWTIVFDRRIKRHKNT